jgi:hypothetical protein
MVFVCKYNLFQLHFVSVHEFDVICNIVMKQIVCSLFVLSGMGAYLYLHCVLITLASFTKLTLLFHLILWSDAQGADKS